MIGWIGVVLGAGLVVLILWMLLTRRLREKYAALWLVLGVVLLVLGVFPQLLHALTRVVGVQIPANLLFAAAIVVLLGVTLHLSWELSQNEDETRRLAEEVAILGARLDAWERRGEAGSEENADGEPGSAEDVGESGSAEDVGEEPGDTGA